MNIRTAALAFALLGAVAAAPAVQLVTNGDFETKDADGIYGAGWDVAANFDFNDDRSYFFDEFGDSPGGEITGASALLNLDDDDDIVLSQTVQTAGISSATLSFDMFSDGYDFAVDPGDPPFDYLEVVFDGHLLETIDLGSDDGDTPFFLHPTYDLTPISRAARRRWNSTASTTSSFPAACSSTTSRSKRPPCPSPPQWPPSDWAPSLWCAAVAGRSPRDGRVTERVIRPERRRKGLAAPFWVTTMGTTASPSFL